MTTLLKSSFFKLKSTYCSRFLSTSSLKEHYDIIIAGGGLVGTSLLVSLGKNDLLCNKKILMLEGARKYKPESRDAYSNRVSAINKRSVQLLESINAWEYIETVRYKPILKMHVWDAISGESIDFSHMNADTNLACIIENDLMLEAMYRQIDNLLNVTILNESKINNCRLPKDGAEKSEVTLKSGEKFTCDLLVGADGFNSIVRKSMNVNNYTMSYNQMGVVGTLQVDAENENTVAWQRFLPTGPVALLPLTKNLSSLVWTTTCENAKELLKMNSNEFVNSLNGALIEDCNKNSIIDSIMNFSEKLPLLKKKQKFTPPNIINVQENSRAQFPLGFSHASSYVVNGAVLIGDAAHRVHPLAGQGVNLGYGDVLQLTDVLSQATYDGANLNDIQYLLKYERERLKENLPIMLGVHTLQRLYCNDFTPIVLARSFGLKLTNSITPIKKFLMSKAIA